MKQVGSYLTFIDNLRVAACVAVILTHVTLGSLDVLAPFGVQWWIAQWICLISQWAVPVFVMISGALLLDPAHGAQNGVRVFYQKRLKRIGWPLLFWTTVYFGMQRLFDREPVTLGYVLDHLLQADPPYHTYFLFLIAGLYLVTPILRVLIQHSTRVQREALIFLIFALAAGYSLANAWFWGNGRFLLSFFVPYLGYYLCGYELAQPTLSLTRRHALWAVGLSLLYIIAIAGPYAVHLGRQNGRFVLGYFSVPVIVISVAIFRAARQANPHRNTRLQRICHRLAPATFGIYLIHVAVLIGLREALAGPDHPGPFWLTLVPGTVLAFGLSYGLTVLLQKVPGLKRLV